MKATKYFDPLFVYGALTALALISLNIAWLIIKAPIGMRLHTIKRLHKTFLGSVGVVLLSLCVDYQNATVRSIDMDGFAPIGMIMGIVAFIYGFFWPSRADFYD